MLVVFDRLRFYGCRCCDQGVNRLKEPFTWTSYSIEVSTVLPSINLYFRSLLSPVWCAVLGSFSERIHPFGGCCYYCWVFCWVCRMCFFHMGSIRLEQIKSVNTSKLWFCPCYQIVLIHTRPKLKRTWQSRRTDTWGNGTRFCWKWKLMG